MSLVHLPLTGSDRRSTIVTAATVRAMEIGQYLIALLLTTIGVIRAIGDGVSVAAALIAGIAILIWHVCGSVLATNTRLGGFGVWWLLGLAAIWIIAVTVSAEFVWVAFLLWLLAGHLLPIMWGVLFSVGVFGIVIAAPIMHHGATSYANVVGPLIGGVFALGISRGYLRLLRDAQERERLVSSLTQAGQEMAELQDELALAQRHSGAIAERTRISRDIHDTIAQALSSIRLLAHAGGERSSDPDAARTLAQIEALAGDSLADVRRIVAALAPAELEGEALGAALQRILDRAHDETGVHVELHVDDSIPPIPTLHEVALLRTAQSALANVRLHAGASRVVLSLIDTADGVRLDITDDGIGFDLAAWERAATEQAGTVGASFGLRFMRTRLRELGGGLDIESTPGEGTAISAYLPLHSEAAPSEAALATQASSEEASSKSRSSEPAAHESESCASLPREEES